MKLQHTTWSPDEWNIYKWEEPTKQLLIIAWFLHSSIAMDMRGKIVTLNRGHHGGDLNLGNPIITLEQSNSHMTIFSVLKLDI